MLLDVLPGASVASSRPHNAVEIASVKALRAALASRLRPSQPMYTRLDWWYNTGNAGELIALGTPTGASKDCLAECRLICDSRVRAPVRDSRPAPRRRVGAPLPRGRAALLEPRLRPPVRRLPRTQGLQAS